MKEYFKNIINKIKDSKAFTLLKMKNPSPSGEGELKTLSSKDNDLTC